MNGEGGDEVRDHGLRCEGGGAEEDAGNDGEDDDEEVGAAVEEKSDTKSHHGQRGCGEDGLLAQLPHGPLPEWERESGDGVDDDDGCGEDPHFRDFQTVLEIER